MVLVKRMSLMYSDHRHFFCINFNLSHSFSVDLNSVHVLVQNITHTGSVFNANLAQFELVFHFKIELKSKFLLSDVSICILSFASSADPIMQKRTKTDIRKAFKLCQFHI